MLQLYRRFRRLFLFITQLSIINWIFFNTNSRHSDWLRKINDSWNTAVYVYVKYCCICICEIQLYMNIWNTAVYQYVEYCCICICEILLYMHMRNTTILHILPSMFPTENGSRKVFPNINICHAHLVDVSLITQLQHYNLFGNCIYFL